MFGVGPRVVCIDVSPNKRGLHPRYWDTPSSPYRGIYTVRASSTPSATATTRPAYSWPRSSTRSAVRHAGGPARTC